MRTQWYFWIPAGSEAPPAPHLPPLETVQEQAGEGSTEAELGAGGTGELMTPGSKGCLITEGCPEPEDCDCVCV